MKRTLLLIIGLLILTNVVFGQEQDRRLRKIAQDFLVESSDLAEGVALYDTLTLTVYDYTNKNDIIRDECVPVQTGLIEYGIWGFTPHSKIHIMLVKNGVYDIIDMRNRLEGILDQLVVFSRNNKLNSKELLSALESVLYAYKVNIQNSGGVRVTSIDGKPIEW